MDLKLVTVDALRNCGESQLRATQHSQGGRVHSSHDPHLPQLKMSVRM